MSKPLHELQADLERGVDALEMLARRNDLKAVTLLIGTDYWRNHSEKDRAENFRRKYVRHMASVAKAVFMLQEIRDIEDGDQRKA